jgi:hypothetical protein
MAKQLAALLGGVDIQRLAELVRQHGRGKDTVLAHITPREAEMLKANGGSGAINPMTGLPEFQESDYGFLGGYEDMAPGADQAPADMGYGMEFETPAIPVSGQMAGDQGTFYPTEIFAPQVSAPVGQDRFSTALQTLGAPQAIAPTIYDTAPQGVTATPMDMNAPQEDRSFQGLLKSGAKQVLGTREGLAGLGTAAAIFQARQAGQQARRMQNELAAIGAPQRALGQQMIAAGQRGEITPVQRQQLEALAARERQQLAQRGLTSGTAAQQAQAQAVMREQRAAQDVLDQGLKIAGIGDQYQAAAIKAGYAADQATRDMLNTTLTNLYRTIYGTTTTPVTTSTTATVPGKG